MLLIAIGVAIVILSIAAVCLVASFSEQGRTMLRWFRDQFAILFVTSWLYMLGWSIVLGAFAVLLYLDGKFSYNLAVGSSIAPAAFMAMGFVFRFFAAVFLMASERSRMLAKAERNDWPEETRTRFLKRRKPQDWERRGKVWRRIGMSISLLVCLHAIGIGLEALSHKRESAKIVREVQDNLQENVDAQLALLDSQKADIRSDLALSTAPLIARAEKLDSDGKLNEERTDAIQARIDKLTDDAQAKINEIDAKKLGLIAPETDEQALEDATAKAEATETQEWAPLFVGIAQFVTMSQEPDDWTIYLCAVAFIVFWVLNAEGIVIFVPKELMKMHMQDSIAASLKDPVRVEAGKKAAETRGRRKRQTMKIQEQADSYLDPWEKAVRYANTTTYTAKGIAQTAFPNISIDHVIEVLRKANKKGDWRPELEEEIALVKRFKEPEKANESKKYAVEVINPDPATTNGTGHSPEQDADHADDTDTAGSVSSN